MHFGWLLWSLNTNLVITMVPSGHHENVPLVKMIPHLFLKTF